MKTMFFSLVIAAACLFAGQLQAQEWTIYDGTGSGTDGLIISSLGTGIKSITKDKQQNIWAVVSNATASTQGMGAFKFDGTAWTFIPLESTFTNYQVAFCDAQGYMWFGTQSGIVRYNDSDGTFTTYNTDTAPTIDDQTTGLPNNNIYDIKQDALGNIWFATYGGGICKYDGTYFYGYPIGTTTSVNRVLSLAIDDQNNIWAGTYKGIRIFDGTEWTSTLYDASNSPLAYDAINDVAIDAAGNKWVTTYNANGSNSTALYKFDGTNWTTYDNTNSTLPARNIMKVVPDAQGNIWIATGTEVSSIGYGVFKFDGTNWTNYTRGNSGYKLFDDIVTDIFIDEATGKKWFAHANGISVLTESSTITGVTLDQSELSLSIGEEATLTAAVTPEDATDKTVSWSSSNESVASVDNTGKVTGVAVGTAVITVTTTDGSKTATCTVTVVDYSWLEEVAIAVSGNTAKVVGPAESVANFTKFYVNDTEVTLTDGKADLTEQTGEISLKATNADGTEVIKLKISK